jgi:hypothetical protein
MPLITAFNLRKDDRWSDIESALRRALVSMPELRINDDEIDFVPVATLDGFHGQVTRINVDLWEGSHRTKEAPQGFLEQSSFSPQDMVTSGPMVSGMARLEIFEPGGATAFALTGLTQLLRWRAPVRRSPAVGRARHAPPHASLHVCNVLKEARTSSVKSFGCSHAAKWQPLGGRP